MSTTPSRQPAGVPIGGQFAAKSNPECDVDLSADEPSEREAHQSDLERLLDERDILQNQIEVAALLLATDRVREVYPDATHIRLDTGYTDIGADPVLGAVITPDGTIEEGDFDFSVQDGVDDVAHLLWPTCSSDREEEMTIELRRVLPADTVQTTIHRQYRPDGSLESESHYQDGKHQDPSDGSPSYRRYSSDGSVEYEVHCQGGIVQDPPDGSPAERRYRPDGSVESEHHYQNGKHQDPPDGSPADRFYRPDGSLESESHFQDGKRQDPPDGSPAEILYLPDGSVGYEIHFQDGERQEVAPLWARYQPANPPASNVGG